jgi:hypothetical protein
MSAAWMVLRQKPDNLDRIAKAIKLKESEAVLVEAFMMNNEYSIDEFRKAIKELGILK